MGRVHDIVLENFKSYEGRVQVGPFQKLSCIIGPNGSGKSNLMDAMSFVLGVQSRQLRSERMRDLVYRKECEATKQNVRIASVELTYVEDECFTTDATLPDGVKKQVFKRSIQKSGETRFHVDGQTVSQADYHSRLEAINILSKARNFLVFQGDVEATAQRQGKDLTAFFEQVSGSDAYRQEYERLAAEKSKKEDAARYLFTKKRHAVNEKKRVLQQKEEAEEFKKLEQERKDLQREFYLFRLHAHERQLEAMAAQLEAADRDMNGVNLTVEEEKSALEQAEQEKAKAHLAQVQAQRAATATKQQLEKLNPEQSGMRSRIRFLTQRVEDLQRSSDKTQDRQQQLSGHAEALRKDQAELESAIAACQQTVKAKEVNFTESQREAFARAQREAELMTAASADKRQELQHASKTLRAERERMEREARETRGQAEQLQRRLSELNELAQVAEASVGRATRANTQRREEQESLMAKLAGCGDEKEQLQWERQQLNEAIQDIRASEQQLSRDRTTQEVCSNLSKEIRGVRGRVIDLCRPSQKRLHVAVNVALGKFIDAIVVDTSETARQCVRYLKEHMLEPMTFLPLKELKVQLLDARALQVVANEPRLRLGLNCVNFDDSVARAFEFLLGGVVIADTLTDGRHVAFGELRDLGVSCKVVTLAGETISKNGNLGVSSDAAREGATRFDVSDLESNRVRVAEIDSRLQTIQSFEARAGGDLVSLRDDIMRQDLKFSESTAQLKWCQEQVGQKKQQFQSAQHEWKRIEVELTKAVEAEQVAAQEVSRHEEGLATTTTSLFQDLSAAMGVEDVCKVHAEWQRTKEQTDHEIETLCRRLNNTRAELAMMDTSLREASDRQARQQSVPALQAELLELQQKEKVLAAQVSSCASELQKLEEHVRSCERIEQDTDRRLGTRRQEVKAKRQQAASLEKAKREIVSKQKAVLEARADELRRSVLEDCEIPLVGQARDVLQDMAEESSQPRAASSSQRAAVPPLDMSAGIRIDFSLLPEEKQAASSGPAAQMLTEEYKSELARLKVELERRSPNLKSLGQVQGAMDNLNATSHEADVARREIEAIEAQFQEVRTARTKRFMDCFKMVSAEINSTYRRITAGSNGQFSDGGSAYLDLDDTDEPYNAGMKYTAMPPGKRFRDMHLLSGGEKTLAAMALLFAVHAYQAPPFMIVDEIDAALDANNVQALANYVEQASCQMIIISLKDRFFVRAEALVGVWKNKPKETSSILTLNLAQYLPVQA